MTCTCNTKQEANEQHRSAKKKQNFKSLTSRVLQKVLS